MRKATSRRVRYQAGDIFLVPLAAERYAIGRIVLDLKSLRKAGMFDTASNVLNGPGFNQPLLLIEIYRTVWQNQNSIQDLLCIPQSHPAYPSEFVRHDMIFAGEYPLVAHAAISASEIDFPEFVLLVSHGQGEWNWYFQKGAISINIGANAIVGSLAEKNELPRPSWSFGLSVSLLEQGLSNLAANTYLPVHCFDLRQLVEKREWILSMAGLDSSMSYDDMCRTKGLEDKTASQIIEVIQKSAVKSSRLFSMP
jgi:Immunity protein 26